MILFVFNVHKYMLSFSTCMFMTIEAAQRQTPILRCERLRIYNMMAINPGVFESKCFLWNPGPWTILVLFVVVGLPHTYLVCDYFQP